MQVFRIMYMKQTMFLQYNIAANLWVNLMVHFMVHLMVQVLTFPMINILYFYISTVEVHLSGRWLSG